MKGTVVRYWAGWLKPESMAHPSWLPEWKKRAELAEYNDEELLVFSVPVNQKGSDNIVEALELFLQERFGIEPLKLISDGKDNLCSNT